MTAFLTFIRAVHFGSCLLLQAVFVVLVLVAVPAWKRSGSWMSVDCGDYFRDLRRLLVACLLTVFVSGFLWLWLAIVGMSGVTLSEGLQPHLLSMVLTETEPGHVWLVRSGLALLLAAAGSWALRFDPGRKVTAWSWSGGALAGVLLTASLAWLGHAGASDGPEHTLQLAGDIIHLLAAGVWPAGLVPLALFLRCSFRATDAASWHAACIATRRFSALSLAAVAVLALSGVVNSYFLVGNFQALVSTDYGRLLLLKLALFIAMIGIGAWNLFLCKSRLTVMGGAPYDDAEKTALAKVRRNVLIEIILCAAILLVVGLLGITAPGNEG